MKFQSLPLGPSSVILYLMTLEDKIRTIAYTYWQLRTQADAPGNADGDWDWAVEMVEKHGYEKTLDALLGSPGAWPIIVN